MNVVWISLTDVWPRRTWSHWVVRSANWVIAALEYSLNMWVHFRFVSLRRTPSYLAIIITGTGTWFSRLWLIRLKKHINRYLQCLLFLKWHATSWSRNVWYASSYLVNSTWPGTILLVFTWTVWEILATYMHHQTNENCFCWHVFDTRPRSINLNPTSWLGNSQYPACLLHVWDRQKSWYVLTV